MYAGQIVETGPTAVVLADPKHRYTQALIGSIPDLALDPHSRPATVSGNPPRRLRSIRRPAAASQRVAPQRTNGPGLNCRSSRKPPPSTRSPVGILSRQPWRWPVAGSGTAHLRERGTDLRRARRGMQMVFQDPVSSLNPRRRVRELVPESLDVWEGDHAQDRDALVTKEHQRSDRGHVPGEGLRGVAVNGAVRRTSASVHPGVARVDSATRPRSSAGGRAHWRRTTVAARPTVRVLFPDALSPRVATVRRGRTRAADDWR